MTETEDFFFTTLTGYKEAEDKSSYLASIHPNQDLFVEGYHEVYRKVNAMMYGSTVCVKGITPFNQYVGADDGHDDLCDFIIWHGKETTQAFIDNPETAIPLAKKMSTTKGFDGDVNSLEKLVLCLA